MKKGRRRPLDHILTAAMVTCLWCLSLVVVSAQVIGPDVSIVKSGPPDVVPGGTIVYTLNYSNNSATLTAPNAIVTEVVPNNTVFVAGSSTAGWSCADGSPAGTTCTFTLGNLAPGASGTLNFAVRVVSSLPAGVNEIANSATITYDLSGGVDPVPGNNVSNRTTPVIGQAQPSPTLLPITGPDLVVTKIDSGPATPAGIITYQITYSNLGPGTATGVMLFEQVPLNTVFVASESTAGWSCPDGSPELTSCSFNVGTLAAGSTNTILFSVRVVSMLPAGANEIANTVSISDDGANGPDPVPLNNISAIITPLVIATKGPDPTATMTPAPATATPVPGTATPGPGTPGPGTPGPGTPGPGTPGPGTPGPATSTPTILIGDPAITKAANPSEARVGDQVEFTITVSNPGDGPAEGVRVVDDVPPFLDLLSVDTTRGVIRISGNLVEVEIGTVNPGEVIVIRILTRVNSYAEPPGNRNVAVVSGGSPGENAGNNNAGATVRVLLPGESSASAGGGEAVASSGGSRAPQPAVTVQTLPITADGDQKQGLSISPAEIAGMALILGLDFAILGFLLQRRKLRLRR